MPTKPKHEERCELSRVKWWLLKEKAIVTPRIELLPTTTADEIWEIATRESVEVTRRELGTIKPGQRKMGTLALDGRNEGEGARKGACVT